MHAWYIYIGVGLWVHIFTETLQINIYRLKIASTSVNRPDK